MLIQSMPPSCHYFETHQHLTEIGPHRACRQRTSGKVVSTDALLEISLLQEEHPLVEPINIQLLSFIQGAQNMRLVIFV
jgi:hypothetical protein